MALVWTGLAYWVVVGVITVIPRVFFPPSQTMEGSCLEGLQQLKTELLDHAQRSLYAGAKHVELEQWVPGWDERYEGLDGQCRADKRKPYEMLGQLRHRVETRIRRQERDLLPLIHQLDRELTSP